MNGILCAVEWTAEISLGNIVTIVTFLFAGMSVFYGMRERISIVEKEIIRMAKDILELEKAIQEIWKQGKPEQPRKEK